MSFLQKRIPPSYYVRFSYSVSVSDGPSFASEISEVFKRAGWHAEAGDIAGNQKHGFSITGGTREDRETVIKAMATVSLIVHSDPDYDGGVMHVNIGPKPPA